MIPLTLTATLRSPVHLGAKNTSANFLAGLGYIPGRALLGAAAWAWLDAGGHASMPEFTQKYVSGAVSWGDLHPVPQDGATGAPIDGVPVVVPRTVKVCKLFHRDHGYVDTLISRSAPNECSHRIDGARCGVGLKRLEGVLLEQANGSWQPPKLHRQHRTHVAIGFETGTAKPGALYSREVLREGQIFRGQILCADDVTARSVLADLKDLPLAVGGGRSRGYGRIEIQVERDAAPSLSVGKIVRQSQSIAAQRAPAASAVRYFTLTAASPWCLREPDGGYARSLTTSWLARALGVNKEIAQVLAGEARSEARSGWDGAAGLPTEVRYLVLAGSTFLCSVTGLDDEGFEERLLRLLQRGIGSHRVEGLGRIIVNHPLHFIAEAESGDGTIGS